MRGLIPIQIEVVLADLGERRIIALIIPADISRPRPETCVVVAGILCPNIDPVDTILAAGACIQMIQEEPSPDLSIFFELGTALGRARCEPVVWWRRAAKPRRRI